MQLYQIGVWGSLRGVHSELILGVFRVGARGFNDPNGDFRVITLLPGARLANFHPEFDNVTEMAEKLANSATRAPCG